ncbi:hypothetical protein [Calothrix sp. CCY 0018]|uniref:hypothetical protein n=1 Tax=Calothrix sp. CCY 0018 TaxID=3103864 RepID=UPI0039C76144
MKKILGIFAASAAALASAMISAPVNAQSAFLPVEIKVTPAIYLRTYSDLKFEVSATDLTTGRSVDQDAGSYEEGGNITGLSTDTPTGAEDLIVTKQIPILYQLWGSTASADVDLIATKTELRASASGGFSGGAGTPVTMTVTEGPLENKTNAATAAYKTGSASFDFTFPSSTIGADTTFTGGEVEIRIVTP